METPSSLEKLESKTGLRVYNLERKVNRTEKLENSKARWESRMDSMASMKEKLANNLENLENNVKMLENKRCRASTYWSHCLRKKGLKTDKQNLASKLVTMVNNRSWMVSSPWIVG